MPDEEDLRPRRIPFLYSVMFLFLSALVLRCGYLQIVKGASIRASMHTTTLTRLSILPTRGRIRDAYGHVLAYDKPSFSVVLTRLQDGKQKYADIARRLAPVVSMPAAALASEMQSRDAGSTQIRLLRNLSQRQVSFIAEHQSELPGVHVVEDPVRAYPYGALAGHVIGYLHPIAPEEADAYRRRGVPFDQPVGQGGVERQYEAVLGGRAGQRVLIVDGSGVPQRDAGLQPAPRDGNSIDLTLDGALQAQADRIVVAELAHVRARYAYRLQDAEAVVLDAHDGGVLAMVSYPDYNPAWYTSGRLYEQHAAFLNGPLTPMVNHVLQSPRAPGSTVKPIHILEGLRAGVISPRTVIADPGYAVVGNFRMKDWQPQGHGLVDPVRAIAESCDTYLYYVGMWLARWHDGPPAGEHTGRWIVYDRVLALNRLYAADASFGLGPKTGIDLPFEERGHVYDNLHLYDPADAARELAHQGWYYDHGTLYDVTAAAIGQNQQFTPIQLGKYMLTMANDGVRLRPHVLKRVVSPTGRVLRLRGREVEARLPIRNADLHLVQRGLWATANLPRGTAYRSFASAPYQAAGKTGTAEVGKNRDISLFVGYAPAYHPQVCVAVMVPGGGESGETAVPIARQLFDAYFREHHEFFPRNQWTSTDIPPNWQAQGR